MRKRGREREKESNNYIKCGRDEHIMHRSEEEGKEIRRRGNGRKRAIIIVRCEQEKKASW